MIYVYIKYRWKDRYFFKLRVRTNARKVLCFTHWTGELLMEIGRSGANILLFLGSAPGDFAFCFVFAEIFASKVGKFDLRGVNDTAEIRSNEPPIFLA
jgi:hypothetical protein